MTKPAAVIYGFYWLSVLLLSGVVAMTATALLMCGNRLRRRIK